MTENVAGIFQYFTESIFRTSVQLLQVAAHITLFRPARLFKLYHVYQRMKTRYITQSCASMQPVMIASTATHISVSSTNSAVPPVPALEDNTTPQNPVIPVPLTSDDSATAHIPVPSTSSTAPNLADQSDDDKQQRLANRTTQIWKRRAAA